MRLGVTNIYLFNTGISNFLSVEYAFKELNYQVKKISNFEDITEESLLVVPGVGHFDNIMHKLEESNFQNIRSLIDDKKTSYTFLTKKELKQNQYKKGDSEGIVNYGLSLKNIHFTAIFIEDELEINLIKISFRSKNEFPCDKFAKEFFSGGGHKNAAGGKFEGTVVNAIKKFKSSLKTFKTN